MVLGFLYKLEIQVGKASQTGSSQDCLDIVKESEDVVVVWKMKLKDVESFKSPPSSMMMRSSDPILICLYSPTSYWQCRELVHACQKVFNLIDSVFQDLC